MSADLTMTTHTAILNDNTVESGDLKMQRTKGDTRALIDFTDDQDRHTIAFVDKTVQMYFPNLKLVQVYKLGKKTNLLDEYLLLGFGTSGKELAKGYDIKMVGSETIEGRATTKLELVPKSASVREQITKVEMWLPLDSGYPVQQKFEHPSGNYRLITYRNFKLNPSFGPGMLKLTPPPSVRTEYPQ